MRKILFTICGVVLLFTAGVFAQQEMKSGGGRFFVSRAGDIIVKARSDKSIALQSNTAVTGTLSVSSTVSIGGGASIAKVLTGTGSVDFTALAAGTCENFTITVTGAANGDSVALGIPAAGWATTEYATIQGFVSATDTVTIKRCNLTNATTALSNPAAVTVRATVFQF